MTTKEVEDVKDTMGEHSNENITCVFAVDGQLYIFINGEIREFILEDDDD